MRRWAVAIIAATVTVTAGCASGTGQANPPSTTAAPPATTAPPKPAPGDHSLTFDHGGTERTYLMHAPPTYTTGMPLVVALHPYPFSGAQMRDLTGLNAKADKENFLVAYPDGLAGGFNALICCGNNDDVGFLRELTTRLVADWGADPKRVYLTGISNGGDMSFKLAVETSGIFAAIGVVSGGFIGTTSMAPTYAPTTPVSVVTIVGTSDRHHDAISEGITRWRERLRCTGSAQPAPAPKVARTAATCADGSAVDVYTVTDMGHVWPGTTTGPLPGGPSHGITATDVVWAFFAAHPMR